jgi:MORN repeat variant
MQVLNRIATVLITGLVLNSCNLKFETKELKDTANTKKDSIRVEVSKHPNGKIKAEVPYKGKLKDGLGKMYDKDGNITLELPYVAGKREGQSKKYYEGGKQVYQTTEYKADKFHGWQVKYRDTGEVMSEARYEDDFACTGLKEYYTDNTLKKEYPKLVITPIDKIQSQGVYSLLISMSEKVRKVKYYTGNLSASGCLNDDLYAILQDEQAKTGKLVYNIPAGAFLMEEVNIIAALETIHGNTYITQRKHNLAIQN